MTTTLRNRCFTSRFFKAITPLVALVCSLLVPLTSSPLAAATPADLSAEYEEWGLEPPVSAKGAKGESESPKPQPPAAQGKDTRPTEGPTVPADLAARFGQAAVLIVAIMEDGKEFHAAGWIIDKERAIVMTTNPLVALAVKLFVAYPQLPGAEKGSLTGSAAVLMQSNSNQDITYLQVESTLPVVLPTLSLANQQAQPASHGQAGSSSNQGKPAMDARPVGASQRNPLVGQWYLQDYVGDYELTIMVRFDEQGKFRMDTISVDQFGSEDRDALVGTYTVRGDTLFLQTNEGPQQAQFKFDDGNLIVAMADGVVTFTFERVR